MVFTRVVTILCFIFLVHLILVDTQKCEVRDFRQKSQPNLCPEGQFCDTSSNRCNKCDRCYNVFQQYIKTTTGDVENILRNLIQKYRRHLNQLQTLVQTIITNINLTEPELGQVNTQSTQVQKKVKHVQHLMRKLRDDITKLQNELKKVGKLTSIEDVVSELKTIKNSVEEIQDKLQLLSFDTDDVALLDLDKFNNVGSALDDMNKRFPILEKTSLSLALSIESDIDLLESMITSFAGKPKGLPVNATANTNWIEDDLLWLFTTLKNYENVSVDINALESNAINTTATARQTLSTLEDLLEKHKAFEKHLKDLKSETDFYKELQKLKERFKLRMDEIQEFKRLLTILMRVVELEKQASSFDNERKQLEKKEKEFKEKYMGELNRLGDELNSVLEQYESLGTTPQEVDLTEIEKMYKEADDIQKEVKKQCKSKIK